MTTEAKYFGNGETATEWVSLLPNQLKDNGVGLWSIVPIGRGPFGLSGAGLIEFVRRSLHSVLAAGARPVRSFNNDWQPDDSYGVTPDAIVENIIAAWLSAGGGDPEWGEYWFVLPRDFRK